MEELFAARGTYSRDMFLHQAAAAAGKRLMGKKREEIEAELSGQAGALLENSCLAGEGYMVRFYEDAFEMENSGSLVRYEYEGIAWICETSEYIVIFWNVTMAIPVEKAGVYRGTPAKLAAFLTKVCGKTVGRISF